MRRSDREIKNLSEIVCMLGKIKECCVAMVDGGKPYLTVMNFGYEEVGGKLIFYFHCAADGRKIEVLKKSPKVYIEGYSAGGVIEPKNGAPCFYGYAYESVAGDGVAEFVTENSEKTRALNLILKHVARTDEEFCFPPQTLDKTCVFKVELSNFTAKKR